jgi:hypothetical protein
VTALAIAAIVLAVFLLPIHTFTGKLPSDKGGRGLLLRDGFCKQERCGC